MASGVGNTTVATTNAGAQSVGTPSNLALAWLFPQPSQPPVGLRWKGTAELVIGREAECSVHLPGNDVSLRHAVLRKDDTGFGVEVVDLGSRNGVHVNGRRVSSASLRRGDLVRLGGWLGVVTETPGAWTEIAPGLFGGVALQSVLAPLQRAAASDLPIILEGETGTGKEVVTRGVHTWSGRSGPLVAVNCAALPEALAEGELFGYRRGAFTGADKPSPGFFRSAEGGTLLLDEVTDLSLPLQAKLLRVLEEHEVQPLGEPRPIPIDVRVVVAGQQSLMEAARQGRFRPDLLARLDGITVRLPPLRSRREDVSPLFSHFLGELAPGCAPAIEIDFVERLCLHDWPFNVRELLLLARRLMVLHGGESTWRASYLPERIGDPSAPRAVDAVLARPLPGPPVSAVKAGPMEPVELPALVAALRASGGNVARAAAMLGITRQRAYRLMEGKAVDLEALRNQEPEPKEAGQ
jgi:transcriptional regulator of acetoin/glycerol metabolism